VGWANPLFKLTRRQELATSLLASDASHIMLYGGSRSGKTFVLLRALLIRALKAERSRHAILRYRFNHIKASIIYDTLPKVADLCFPGVWARSKLDKTDWFLTLPNGSEVWFGGLDDKERTEKILGQEYATVYLNECSQIPWASRNMAMTRLAQKVGLKLKAYYDCNPPGMAHWTYRLFIERRDPDNRSPLARPENFASLVMNPTDNEANLDQEYIRGLQEMGERMRRRFFLGQFADASESALWTLDLLDQQRILDGKPPEMQRIIIAVDPSGCSGKEDERSDEVGIVVVGLGVDGKAYVLEDLSGKFGPEGWGNIVVSAFDRHEADAVVAETNYGGAMVGAVIRAAGNATGRRQPIPFREVTASRGKVVRAEPVSVLFEQQKVYLVGRFEALEDQLCAFTTSGYAGSRSPDRADAMVWALTELFPAVTKREASPLGSRPPRINVGYATQKRRRA
jgi:predicted phage terminase large subunit-like protein